MLRRTLTRGLRRVARRLFPHAGPLWYHTDYRLPLTTLEARLGLEPRRADLVLWYLRGRDMLPPHLERTPTRATYTDLARVHDAAWLESLTVPSQLARVFGVDTWDVDPDEVLRSIRLACGGTLAATRAVLKSGRWAGNLLGGFHHAGRARGGGLCPVNDIAVAVEAVRAEGFTGRVLVLDFDAHPPDGTADCFDGDDDAWIGSISGSTWGALPGVDETVLEPGSDDASYLTALDALLARMPPGHLAFVIAGGDVLADDRNGTLSLTLDGARKRDRRVFRALRGTPSVWLPGGGYHPDAWKVLTGTALILLGHPRHRIPARADPLAMHYATLSAQMGDAFLDPTWLGDDDLVETLGGPGRRRSRRLLATYTAEGVELILSRFGLLTHLRRLGYRDFRVDIDHTGTGERFRLFGAYGVAEHVLAEAVLERRDIGAEPFLFIHWLNLRHPAGAFSDRKPQLPGQDVPGLGLAREASELMRRMAIRLNLAGVAAIPSWYHIGVVTSAGGFGFADPARQGRFEALQAALADLPLPEATRVVAEGRVRLDGEPYAWEATEMVSWLDPARAEDPARLAAIAAERDRVRFTRVADPG